MKVFLNGEEYVTRGLELRDCLLRYPLSGSLASVISRMKLNNPLVQRSIHAILSDGDLSLFLSHPEI